MENACNIKSHPWLQEAGKFSSTEVTEHEKKLEMG